ncbi:hypothetical protein [Novosphingobium sp. PY1]|uniref:hypothetical protein n=1 Tax=Novosphingobium sp. PY1 TaxID=1882221 RepID=UPI001A8E6982|nr:hypothetical protein [Novosphingobium sp. PY1]
MKTVVYGECVHSGACASVRISSLADSGCDLEIEAPAALDDGECTLWIGAIGPFPATAIRKTARQLLLRFKEPLDRKIVAHFNCAIA